MRLRSVAARTRPWRPKVRSTFGRACAWQESNLRPCAPEAHALSPELQARCGQSTAAPIAFPAGGESPVHRETVPGRQPIRLRRWTSPPASSGCRSPRHSASRARRPTRRRWSRSRSATATPWDTARRLRSSATSSPPNRRSPTWSRTRTRSATTRGHSTPSTAGYRPGSLRRGRRSTLRSTTSARRSQASPSGSCSGSSGAGRRPRGRSASAIRTRWHARRSATRRASGG